MHIMQSVEHGTNETSTTMGRAPIIAAVHPISAEKAVTDALRDAILSGHLSPGERLAQAELARQLGVSRIPLRDALRRLEEEALVRIDGRRGAWVTTLNTRDIAEIYELRIMLEGRCVRHAVGNLSDEDTELLLELSKHMDTLERDEVKGRAARREFYSKLYSHARRPRMHRLIMQLRDNVGRYHLLQNTHQSQEAHSALRRCIRMGRAGGAVRAVTEHLEEARDDLIGTMAEEHFRHRRRIDLVNRTSSDHGSGRGVDPGIRDLGGC